MRSLLYVAAISASLLQTLYAQVPVTEAITGKYSLTRASADHKDIVTAGSLLVLKKDGLIMFATDAKFPASTTYKDGRLQPAPQNNLPTKKCPTGIFIPDKFCQAWDALGGSSVVKRKFVAGEKFWLIDVQSQQDGVQLQLLSNPYSDVRYMTYLKFPVAKGGSSSSDQVLEHISEVVSIDASEATVKPPIGTPPAPAEPQPPLPVIVPPPPPADQQVPTIGIGSTKEQVVAAWGQPNNRATMPSEHKEFAYYTDRKTKVTYENDIVTHLE